MTEPTSRIKRARIGHRVSLAGLAISIALFFIAGLLFELPSVANTAFLLTIAVLSLAMGITTMIVMINKTPGSDPEQ
jgi:hypothetical protein